MDRDDVNIISHLYFAPAIADADAKRLVYCYTDTKQPLSGTGAVLVERGEWRLAPGVVGFPKLAEASLTSFPPHDWIFGSPLRDPLAQPVPQPACFLAMPYGPTWFGQVRDAVERAATTAGKKFDIASDIAKPSDIMTQVWTLEREAQVVVADLTGLNPNVMYEFGVAHSLGKPTILITQHPDTLPFDVTRMRWHAYDLSSLNQLESNLLRSFSEI